MAPRKAKFKYPLVKIVWVDAESGNQEWVLPEELDGALPQVTTVGFLIKETEDAYIIASTITDTHVNGQFKIPKGMTKEKVELLTKEKAP